MRFRLAVLMVIVLSLVLTACGGGNGGDSDSDITKPTKDFFQAFEELDAEKAANTVCKQYRDEIKEGLEMTFGFLALAGEDAKIEIVDLKLKVEDKKDDEATVVATGGKVRITFMGEVQEQDLAEDADMGAVKVIKEDGKWVICDDSLSGAFE